MSTDFRVVGVGASAGGITALQELLSAMRFAPELAPELAPKLAIVVIQHMSADQPSRLPALLGSWSALPVSEALSGVGIVPGRVYVVPPEHVVEIDGDVFVVRGGGVPGPQGIDAIDRCFEGLARRYRERMNAVVLSGTGSDGAAGALFVRLVGGTVYVQEPVTAMFDAMPHATIRAHAANHVMSVGEIARTLGAGAKGIVDAEPVEDALTGILALIRRDFGSDLSGYRMTPLLRRIQSRMGTRRVARFSDYHALLRDDPAELEALSRSLPVHVTAFFRDPPVWRELEHVLATLATKPVRAWCAACSTGQEAYTVAMLLAGAGASDFQVFATDAASDVVGHAARGMYTPAEVAAVDPDRVQRFFYEADGGMHVRHELREKLVFAAQDVLVDAPFTGVDLITCRNFLIYLERDAVESVVKVLHSALRMGGYLVLGTAEALPDDSGFTEISPSARIYQKTSEPRPTQMVPHRLRPEGPIATRSTVLAEDPPAVIVDEDFRVLRTYGDTRAFLRFPHEPTFDLLKLLPPAIAMRSRPRR